MKKKVTKVLQQTSLLIMLFMATAFTATAQYTLTDADVVVTGGIIESCSYNFATTDIIIPATLDGQTVTGIADAVAITSGVFYNKGITSLVLPATLTTIGDCAFNTNSITSVDVSACSALVSIGASAFYYNNITSLDLSASAALTSIGASAFIWNDIASLNMTNCTALNSIGSYAFADNSLTSLDLSACTALTSLGTFAFFNNHDASYTTYLTNFNLPTPTIAGYKLNYWVDGNSIQYAGGATVGDVETSYIANLSVAYDLTFTVTDGTNSISGATVNLTGYGAAITNASGVAIYIGVTPASNIAYNVSATSYTSSTSTVSVVNTNVNKAVTLSILTTYILTDADVVVTGGIIQSCSYDFTVKDIIIPATLDGQTVTGIRNGTYNDGVFYNKGMTSVVLPATLRSIGDYAFYSNSLSSVDLSACTSLTSIGADAFSENPGLSTFALPSPNHPDFQSWIDDYANEYAAGASVSDFTTAYRAVIPYTLTDDDVVVSDGIIQSCSYDFTVKDIIIPETLDAQTVTGIRAGSYTSDGVFYNKGITSVVLPATLNSIGNYAFSFNSLTSLDLSTCTALTSIGAYAFYGIPSLSTFDLASPAHTGFQSWIDGNGNNYAAGATVSDYTTFYRAIISYTLTDADVVVTSGIIQSCSYDFTLTDIVIPTTLDGQTVTGIKDGSGWNDGVFYNKGITSVVLPATLSSIGNSAFNDNSLTSLDLSICSALTSIGDVAFYSNSLTSIDLSACTALSSIGSSAFSSNSLTSVDLSACTALDSIEGWAFSYNSLTSVDLSACTTLSSIGNYAFYHNYLAEISLPNSITYMGEAVFNNNEIIKINGISSDGIIYARNTDASIDNSIIVSYGGASKNVIVPAQVVIIGENAFYANFLTGVDLSACNGLISIERSSFAYNSLNSIDLSACTALTSIRSNAFANNIFTEFALPSPSITGYQFNNWQDWNSTEYAGGTMVNNLSTSYTANLTGNLKATFTISDGTNPVVGANVGFGNYGTTTTDASGIASFTGVAPANNIAYTISAIAYDNASGTVTLVDSDVSKDVSLSLTTYELSFTIIAGTNAIANATVSLTGYGTATSNASGIATFTGIAPANDIAYTVSATNYDDVSATISIVDSDVSKEIQLIVTGFSILDNNRINVYPNPATDILTIIQATDEGITNVELYSLQGQKLKMETIANNQEMIKLNIQDLEPGGYLLKCTTRNNHILSKTIMKK